MSHKLAITLAAVLLVTEAQAQKIYWADGNNVCPIPTGDSIGNEIACLTPAHLADLDRAHDICLEHALISITSAYPPRDEWESPWKKCKIVQRRWEQSAADKELKAQQKQEQKDIDFVNSVAKMPK